MRLLAALLLVVAFSAGACRGEAVYYEYAAWNYSDDVYVVIVNDNGAYVGMLVVPAHASVYRSAVTAPDEAVLYDATCSKRLQTLKLHPGVGDVVIAIDGSMSAAASPLPPPGSSGPPLGATLAIPAGCDQYLRH
jgi:hypothetical protein